MHPSFDGTPVTATNDLGGLAVKVFGEHGTSTTRICRDSARWDPSSPGPLMTF